MTDSLNFNHETFITRTCGVRHEEMNDTERIQLGMILMHPVMQKALGLTFFQLTEVAEQFMSLDLGSLSGLAEVARMQGQLRGYTNFINVLGSRAASRAEE